MPAFQDFTLYFAKSIAQNTAALADLKITNLDGIDLVYCIPSEFTKRFTDTSNALSLDKTEPDSGSGKTVIEIQITQDRKATPTTNVLKTLLEMFFKLSDDVDFRKGRFGLLNDDNPELDVKPTRLGGYKFLDYKQIPNKDEPSILIYNIHLAFLGDHTLLGAFQ